MKPFSPELCLSQAFATATQRQPFSLCPRVPFQRALIGSVFALPHSTYDEQVKSPLCTHTFFIICQELLPELLPSRVYIQWLALGRSGGQDKHSSCPHIACDLVCQQVSPRPCAWERQPHPSPPGGEGELTLPAWSDHPAYSPTSTPSRTC